MSTSLHIKTALTVALRTAISLTKHGQVYGLEKRALERTDGQPVTETQLEEIIIIYFFRGRPCTCTYKKNFHGCIKPQESALVYTRIRVIQSFYYRKEPALAAC